MAGTHLADLETRRLREPGILSRANFVMAMRDTGYKTTSLATPSLQARMPIPISMSRSEPFV